MESHFLTRAQKAQAVEVLARAFLGDPMYTSLIPDADERARSLRWLWSGLLTYGLRYGEVHTTPEVKGVACWLPPGQTQVTLWRTLRSGMALPRAVMRFSKESRRRTLGLLEYVDALHAEITEPHWYLWVLGVDPDAQGQGIGGRLLKPVLARADESGTACYLETETESNVGFYERRGFDVVHEGVVPGETIRLWTMLRKPQ